MKSIQWSWLVWILTPIVILYLTLRHNKRNGNEVTLETTSECFDVKELIDVIGILEKLKQNVDDQRELEETIAILRSILPDSVKPLGTVTLTELGSVLERQTVGKKEQEEEECRC